MSINGKTQTKNAPVSGGLRNLSPKTMAMIALLTVMGILWGRVLLSGKNAPASAEAMEADALQSLAQGKTNEVVRIEPVSLTITPGRNDSLSHDFFSADNWKNFGAEGRSGGYTINDTGESDERMQKLKLEQLTKRLTLEAVVKDADGHPVQAFVDGKILSVGSELTVQEGPDQYVLTVEKISENQILFSWNQVSVVLEIPESYEF